MLLTAEKSAKMGVKPSITALMTPYHLLSKQKKHTLWSSYIEKEVAIR